MGSRGIHPKGENGVVSHNVPHANRPCCYCKRPMVPWTPTHPTRDHILPAHAGGTKTVPCCHQCNQIKGGRMPAEWFKFMNTNPNWWEKSKIGPINSPDVCPVLVMVAEFFMRKRYGVWRSR